MTQVRLYVYSGPSSCQPALTGSCKAAQCSRQTVPLGNLQGIGERWLSLEGLLVKKALDRVVGQLFHDDEGFTEVQQHGEVVILSVSQDVDALGQNDVRGFLKPPDLVPGDDQFHYRVAAINEN